MNSGGNAYERYGIEADASSVTSVINGPGTLSLVSDQTGSPIEFTVQAGTPPVGLLVNAAIVRVGGLTKDGPGGMVMAGANTYSGNTTVSNGTLTIIGGGSINNGGQLIVSGANGPAFNLNGGARHQQWGKCHLRRRQLGRDRHDQHHWRFDRDNL